MCIAIWNPPEAQDIEKAVLARCRDANPDGMGMAWAEAGRLHVIKRLSRFGKFYRSYTRARAQHKGVLLHFRIATSGKRDFANCHPFQAGTDAVLCHNGIFGDLGTPEISDTREFVGMLDGLVRAVPSWWKSPEITPVLQLATAGSKCILLRADGDVWLLNEADGHWHEGSWWSNDTYKESLFTRMFVGEGYTGVTNSQDIRRTWGGLPVHNERDVWQTLTEEEQEEERTRMLLAPPKRLLSRNTSVAFLLGPDVYCLDCLPTSQMTHAKAVDFMHPVYCVECGQIANEDDEQEWKGYN